jgi:diacylglycerol kinase (ATP)
MKHIFIINSLAGKGNYKDLVNFINFKKFELDCELFITSSIDQVHKILNQFKINNNKIRIYSIGGDGTLNCILNAIKTIGNNASIAVVPVGTGNDFSNMIYSDKKINHFNLINNLINGIEKKVDIGTVNGKYFLNVSSIGFDSDVVINSNKLKKMSLFPSKLSYFGGIFLTLLNKKHYNCHVEIDGNYYADNYLFVVISNGKYYGGGFMPTPNALISDGLFDICIVNDIPITNIIKLIPLYKNGKHANLEIVQMLQGRKIIIKSNTKMGLNIDGDIIFVNNAEFSIIPKGIEICFPQMK